MRISVIPLTEKSKIILQQNTDKFGMSKVQSKVLRKVGDRYTTTEIITEPFSINVIVKAEYNAFITKEAIYDKVRIAVEKILIEHQGSIKEVSIEVQDD